jgi:hypothetical protein
VKKIDLKHQKGAVMLETVYVLPIMVLTILMIVEMVNYASDTLVWNENMNNLYQRVMTDANQGSSSPFKSSTGMLTCSEGTVTATQNASDLMRNQLFDWLQSRYKLTGSTPPITAADITVQFNQVNNDVGQGYYVVQADYPVQTLLLPELKDIFSNFRVTGTSIYDINFSCQASS